MASEASDPSAKLNMSLDALIAQDRKRDSENKGNGGRGAQSQGRQNQGRGRFPGRGRGPQQGRGGFQGGLRQEQQHFHNGGFPGGPRPNGRGFNFNGGFGPMRPPFPEGTIIMPNFGLPFGSFPPQRLPPMFTGDQRFDGPGMPPSLSNGRADASHQGGPEKPKPSAPAPVPLARLDEETGEVTVRVKGKIIVKVAKSGLITLNTDGMRTAMLFMALNAVLNTVGISITRPQNNDEWSISDGRSLTRFRDGVTLPGRGPQSLQRGQKILTAFGGVDPNAAAAATLASNAAAEAAGIVLGRKTDNQQNKKPGGSAPQEREGNAGQNPPSSSPDAGQGSGGKSSEDADRIRRLRAKGRYKPY